MVVDLLSNEFGDSTVEVKVREAHMRNNLSVLLIANNVKCRITDGCKSTHAA